jgi:hypothetical protein
MARRLAGIMGVITYIHYVSEDPSSATRESVSEILRLFETETVPAVYLAMLGRRWRFGRTGPIEPQQVGHFCSASHAAESYRRGTRVHIDAGAPPRARRLSAAVRAFFPEDVRDNYSPGKLTVVVGKSVLYDIMNEDEDIPEDQPPPIIANPYCRTTLWGYGSPPGFSKFKERLSKIDEFAKLETDLATILPSMRRIILISA